jgi:glycogen debranching enzyme
MQQRAELPTEAPDSAAETPFYIPLTGPSTRPRRTLKHDDTFAVVDSHGDIGASPGGRDGLFHRDTRFLSRFELLVNGMQPLLLGSNQRDDNTVLTVDLSNPDIYLDGHLLLEKDVLHIVRTIFLWRGAIYQRIAVHNHFDRPVAVQLTFAFGADFADLFEVRGMRRGRRGISGTPEVGAGKVVLNYHGLDQRTRQTSLIFDPEPTQTGASAVSYRMRVPPGETIPLFLCVTCDQPEGERPAYFFRGMIQARRELKAARRQAAEVETSNDIFNEFIRRSTADVHMLTTQTPHGRYPYAGIPWYSTTFGRDGLITALQLLSVDPSLASDVLQRLAALQATEYDPHADAEPGKILHEMRGGEMAELGEVPFGLYYGSIDSTPLFVLLLGLYAERTGDYELVRSLWPHVEAALRWIDGPGDPDRDGFVEYNRATSEGLVNQGWKDSPDAVFHADGSLAEGPIALAEVQGYIYAAKRAAANCAASIGREEQARVLNEQAQRLSERFNERFWCEEIGTYALALDGDKNQCRVRSSNAGQLLFTGIVPDERARRVADQLLEPRFFNGWGIRTIARGEARYNPMSYHNGTIWPHDNSLIGLGFARYGFTRHLNQIFRSLFEAASYMELRRLPELFCGFQRGRSRGPTFYPVACSPQAWASAAPFLLLQASLGLCFEPARNAIRLRDPMLPDFLEEVRLRNLRLGEASVDLLIRRRGDSVLLDVLRRTGSIEVGRVLS